MATKNIVSLQQLDTIGACFEARTWFNKEFPKDNARFTDVMKAAVAFGETGWVSWFINRTNISRQEGLAIFKLASETVEKVILSTTKKGSDHQLAFLKGLAAVRRGRVASALRYLPYRHSSNLNNFLTSALSSLEDVYDSKRSRVWNEIAVNTLWVTYYADQARGNKKFTYENRAISLFNTFEYTVTPAGF